MLQVARLAPRLLGESSALVAEYIRSQLNDDGGFRDRHGDSDLYYTVFGTEALQALQEDVPLERIAPYAEAHDETNPGGAGLDLVHVSCLARCFAALDRLSPGPLSPATASPELLERRRVALAERLNAFRTPDGGYHNNVESESGTVYGCFLALGMSQDLGCEDVDAEGVAAFLESMETDDGAYANERTMNIGTTPATAAAVAILRTLGLPQRHGVGEWLEARFYKEGGFYALPGAPMPDLLSTATALHALAGLERSIERMKDPCLDFVDSLWTNRGGFHGNWADDDLDCEYTYYGLLALGHLSL